MIEIYKSAYDLLAKGESFVLATILSQLGSAPRTAGAKMIVQRDGSIIGTIGGGSLEAGAQQMAGEVWQTQKPQVRQFNFNGADAQAMDMICGGQAEVLVDYIDAGDPDNLIIYREICQAIEERKKVVLITSIMAGTGNGESHCLVKDDGTVLGAFDGQTEQLTELTTQAATRYPVVLTTGGRRYLVETIFDYGTVYILGAGHVSQKLAMLTARVDFNTVVLDDRQEFANQERFPEANRIIVLDSFAQALESLVIDQDSYVVIVTRGHAHDKTVLAAALKTDAGYIGMIGSTRKRNAIYRALLEEGFTNQDIARVYAPIGLEISAETPEEIAVSIVGELIKVRAEKSGRSK